jgi:endo-1,4-beta-xylanase
MRTSPLHLYVLPISLAIAGCGSTSNGPGTSGSTELGGSANSAAGETSTAGRGGGSNTGGMTGTAGSATNTGGTGGARATGAAGASGAGTSGATGAAGASGAGTSGAAGATGAGGSGAAGATGASGAADPDCSTTLPTGGTTYTGTNINGKADGLNYGIWTNGSGGSLTVFTNAHAFSTTWNNSSDFLAHVGLDFNTAKSYTAYGAIVAQFVESKTGTAGGFSSIGMYGWMHNPCVEWYINEDSFGTLSARGNATATIDGATYSLSTTMTTGTGGANACEAGHTGSWTQMFSTRKTARQCGTVTVSDHFAAWAAQGWTLGTISSVHINVEVGGGVGSIQFPVANVTTANN